MVLFSKTTVIITQLKPLHMLISA